MDTAQVHAVRYLVSRLSPAWAMTATRCFPQFRTTSHCMQKAVRDACPGGASHPDSLSPFRVARRCGSSWAFVDADSIPHHRLAAFYGMGSARDCADDVGATRRCVLACAAYSAVRARRRDVVVLEAIVATDLARAATVQVY